MDLFFINTLCYKKVEKKIPKMQAETWYKKMKTSVVVDVKVQNL